MDSRRNWTVEHYRMWSSWQEQVSQAVRRPWLLRALLHAETRSRFFTLYAHLRALPRRTRRALQRQAAQSLAGLALVLALGQGQGLAATINVTGGCTLVNAITSANTDSSVGGCVPAGSGADTLTLGAGSTHTLTAAIPSVYGDNGLPVVTTTITIQGNGSTIERGAGAPNFRILAVSSGGNLTLRNLTVRGGDSIDGGGGVYNLGTLTLTNTTVSGNAASNVGGVYNLGTLTLAGSTVSNNVANSGFVGGVDNEGTLTLTSSTVSGNTASAVGGVFNYGSATITNSTISGNTATTYDVGGVANFGALTLTNSTVSGNTTPSVGGGMLNDIGSTLTLTNSTVSGNTAGVYGGGVSNSGGLTITNSTLSGNMANSGGGVDNYNGTLTLTRTVVSGNTAITAPEVYDNSGTVTANNFNVFGFSSTSGVVGFTPGATDIVPTVALSSILTSTLAFNGGPTRTQALVVGSPAVDTVTNGSCPPPATDQRGFVRPFDGNGVGGAQCDSGAFEFGAVLPPVQNSQLTFMVLKPTRTTIPNADGCPVGMGFTAKFHFEARLTNTAGSLPLSAIKAVVTTLGSPRLLQNADGGAGGVGATLTVAEAGPLSDGVLSAMESVDVPFVVCLPNTASFQLNVNVVGVK